MTDNPNTEKEKKKKRASKGQRKHIRRVKQEARKTGTAQK